MFRTDQGSFLELHLTQDAASRLLEATSKSRGRFLITTRDGHTILSAPIEVPIGKSFRSGCSPRSRDT
jgi:hypothetical protein